MKKYSFLTVVAILAATGLALGQSSPNSSEHDEAQGNSQ